jgi:putative peptidoglycan lipid II flippase
MVVVTQIGGLVQTIVASSAVSGRANNPAIASVAAAAIAWLIFMLPHSVATVSIATSYFTRMSKHAHDNRIDLLKNDLAAGLRAISVISVFATFALIVLAYPVARIFVGEFAGTAALGNVLIALMFGLVPFSFVFMMQRAFFSLEDTRTPFWFTVVQISMHIAGALTIAATVAPAQIVVALSLLTSVTILIQAVIAYTLLSRRIGSLAEHRITQATTQFLISGFLAATVGWFVLQLFGGLQENAFSVDSVISSVLTIGIVGFVMLAVYIVALRLLRVAEVDTVLGALKGILRR